MVQSAAERLCSAKAKSFMVTSPSFQQTLCIPLHAYLRPPSRLPLDPLFAPSTIVFGSKWHTRGARYPQFTYYIIILYTYRFHSSRSLSYPNDVGIRFWVLVWSLNQPRLGLFQAVLRTVVSARL